MSIKDIINDDAKLTEIAKPCFDALDADKSGKIDEKELESAFKQIAKETNQKPPSKDEIKQFLNFVDTDKSGKIDLNEFKALIKMFLVEVEKELNK